jgi:hypothetical protein
MDIAFDHKARDTGRAAGRVKEEFEGFPSAPDWNDLRSRLFAAHEVRVVLSSDTGPVRLRTRGSFADETALLLNTYGTGSRLVNLNISSNGKSEGVKVTSVAGTDNTGGRG